jgi:thiosulfate dehydrogenase [quinone] large subunit
MIASRGAQASVALLRVGMGLVFLWAALEKLLGPAGQVEGFLKYGTAGTLGWPFVQLPTAVGTVFNPTYSLWSSMADNSTVMAVIFPLVALGQLGIGIGLVLGLLTRFSAAMGTLLLATLLVAQWNFIYGIVNQHIAYGIALVAIAGTGAGRFYGLDNAVARMPFAQQRPWLVKWFLSGEPIETEQRVPALDALPDPTPA